MKIQGFAIVISLTIAGWSSSGSVEDDRPTPAAEAVDPVKGDSISNAVVIRAKNTEEGIAAQRRWMEKNVPGGVKKSQFHMSRKGKHYDVVTVLLPGGKERIIYFDVSSFFGKS